jgi:hypothetical protein
VVKLQINTEMERHHLRTGENRNREQMEWDLDHRYVQERDDDISQNFIPIYSNTEQQEEHGDTPNALADMPRRSNRYTNTNDALPVPEFSADDVLPSVRIQTSRWELPARFWVNTSSEQEDGIKEMTFDLPKFIYGSEQGLSANQEVLVRESPIRWFHIPVNNVGRF